MTPAVTHRLLRAGRRCAALALCGCGLAAGVPAAAGAPGAGAVPAAVTDAPVTVQFARALKAYGAGKQKTALRQLSAILRRYPDHQPSQLLLGRILYRIGKVNLAAKHFARVGVDLIGPDVAFEYGAALFTAKDCKRAVVGLARVPEGSRQSDLALFYRGICAMRYHDWQHADTLLSRAVDLPDYLDEPRRQALQQVRALERAEQHGGIGGASAIIIVPTQAQTAEVVTDEGGKDSAKKPPAPILVTPTGLITAVTPSLTLTDLAFSNDYNGYSKTQLEKRRVETKVDLLWKYNAQPRGNGGQPYASFALDAEQLLKSTNGNTVDRYAISTDPNNTLENSKAISSARTVGYLAGNPEVSWPLSGLFQLTGGYHYAQWFPNMDRNSATKGGSMGPYAEIDAGKATLLKLTAAQLQTVDQVGKVTLTEVDVGADVSKTFDTLTLDLSYALTTYALDAASKPTSGAGLLGPTLLPDGTPTGTADGSVGVITASVKRVWEALTLSLQVSDTQNTITDPGVTLTGEEQNLGAQVTGTHNLDIGGNLTLTVAGAQLSNSRQLVDDPTASAPPPAPPQVVASGSGTQYSVLGSFKLAPVEWVYGLVSYQYQVSQFSGVDPALQVGFDRATIAVATTLTIQIQVSKVF